MKIDFNKIKKEYERQFFEYSKAGSNCLSFHVEDWYDVLDKPQREIFSEIKSVGVFLYPYYPIANSFVNFGNPFLKVGLEIIYKDFKIEKENKIKNFEKDGWQIYTINAFHDRLSYNDLFYQKYRMDINDVDYKIYFKFLHDNKDNNLDCLLNYLKIVMK